MEYRKTVFTINNGCHDPFIPDVKKWTFPTLNMVRTIVQKWGLSQKSKWTGSVDPNETAHDELSL